MKYIAFDTETYPFVISGKATTKQIPRLVCMSYYYPGMVEGAVVERERAVPLFRNWFDDPDIHFIGHNVTFDILVMVRAMTEVYGRDFAPEVFKLYSDRRVHDTILHDQLRRIDKRGTIENTGYTLAYMAKRYCNITLGGKSGDDVWRARYNELEGIRAEDYPYRAYEYAKLDAEVTYKLWEKLTKREHYTNETFQLCADLGLRLMSAWGVMIDQEHTQWLMDHYSAKVYRLSQVLTEGGIMRENGTNDTSKIEAIFEAAWKKLGRPVKMTDTGKGVSRSKDTLQLLKEAGFFDLADTDEATKLMRAYSEYQTATKFISTYLDPLADAGQYPVCTRFKTLVNSGRTSSSGPNVQNFPAHMNADEKRLEAQGFEGPFGRDIRGCIIPREGRWFLVADYSSMEMVTLAQVMCNIAGGVTEMGQVMNMPDSDPHIYLLSEYRRQDYDTLYALYKAGDATVARERQITKAANYAFGGWAYPDAFKDYVKGYGVVVDDAEATRAFKSYHRTYPDVERYHFKDILRSETRRGTFDVELHGPNRMTRGWMRRRCWKKTQAANTRFQSLAGALTKYALWNLQYACYVDKSSPLYGDRTVLYIHDEFVLEVDADEGKVEEKGNELSRIMVESAKLFIPDIEVEADWKILKERWAK